VEQGESIMMRRLVDLALNNRFIVLSIAILLFIWGIISFKKLPVEAYPDVANTWVQVITQWPGRAAEEVEQQVTVPIEIQMNGIPHLEHVRSASLAGLSVVNLIFDDDSDNDCDRQKVLERLNQVTLPPNVTASIGPDFSPIGSIYWYTVQSDNPAYDLMELIVDDAAGAIRTCAEKPQALVGSFQIDLGFVRRVLGDLKFVLRDRAFIVEQLARSNWVAASLSSATALRCQKRRRQHRNFSPASGAGLS
jgi:hypothetical protein